MRALASRLETIARTAGPEAHRLAVAVEDMPFRAPVADWLRARARDRASRAIRSAQSLVDLAGVLRTSAARLEDEIRRVIDHNAEVARQRQQERRAAPRPKRR